jgi:hypothetical protein
MFPYTENAASRMRGIAIPANPRISGRRFANVGSSTTVMAGLEHVPSGVQVVCLFGCLFVWLVGWLVGWLVAWLRNLL